MIKGIKKSLLLIMCATAFQLCAEPEQFKKEIKELLASAKATKETDPATSTLYFACNFLLRLINFNIDEINKVGMDEESCSQRYVVAQYNSGSFKLDKQIDITKLDLAGKIVRTIFFRLYEEEEQCLQKGKQEQVKCALALNEFVGNELAFLRRYLNERDYGESRR